MIALPACKCLSGLALHSHAWVAVLGFRPKLVVAGFTTASAFAGILGSESVRCRRCSSWDVRLNLCRTVDVLQVPDAPARANIAAIFSRVIPCLQSSDVDRVRA